MAWQEVMPNSDVWVYEYRVNGYRSNAIALPLNERDWARDWAIVSPPVGISEADFAEINALGRVTALIAPSAAHDLGQAEWQVRYPEAIPYAPTSALSQLKLFQRPFMPLSQLSASSVEFREVPGTQKGGTIAIAKRRAAAQTTQRPNRPIVYLDELVINWSSLPSNWTKLLFWLTGSAPRLKINRIYSTLFCPHLPSVAKAVLHALEGDPMIIPAHGDPLVQCGDADRVRALVEPLVKTTS